MHGAIQSPECIGGRNTQNGLAEMLSNPEVEGHINAAQASLTK